MQERDAEIDLLHKQLEEFRVGSPLASVRMAYAVTDAGSVGSSGVALAERPSASMDAGPLWGSSLPTAKLPAAVKCAITF